MPQTSDKYINQTLLDGLEIFKQLLEKTTPFQQYSITDLTQFFPELDYQKLYRTCKTFEKTGFIEEIDGKFRLSEYIYLLSHRFFKSLEAEHQRIADTINKFNL